MPKLPGTKGTKTFTKTGEMALKEAQARERDYEEIDRKNDEALAKKGVKVSDSFKKKRKEARDNTTKLLMKIAKKHRKDTETYEKEKKK